MTREELQIKYPHIEGSGLLDGGWDWLLLKAYGYIHALQTSYLKLVPGQTGGPYVDAGPIFKFKVWQIKQKFGGLRFYYSIEPKEFDWSLIDKTYYDATYDQLKSQISGFVDAVEYVSNAVCEISGERGTKRDINGWICTLSDKEYNKLIPK